MTQLVVAAAGAAIGFAIGGPQGAQLGWAIGSAVGAGLGPAQKVQGPRLSDLKVSGTEYGQAIPYIQGHPGIAGQLWWSSDRREIATTTTQGGKGGPSVESTSYTYEVDLLIGLSDNIIAGVGRVWSNGKLIWTNLSSSDSNSLIASAATERWRRMTVYTGAASQLPDATYEAAVGVGNAPAYRGRGSVFIEGLQLGASGAIPNLTFEVSSAGGPANAATASIADFARVNPIRIGASAYSNGPFDVHVPQWDSSYATSQVKIFRVYPDHTQAQQFAYNVLTNTNDVMPGQTDVSGLMMGDGGLSQAHWYQWNPPLGVFRTDFAMPVAGSFVFRFCKVGNEFFFVPNTGSGFIAKYSASGGTWQALNTGGTLVGNRFYSVAAGGSSVWANSLVDDLVHEFDRTSLAFIQSFATPSGPPTKFVTTDENGDLWCVVSTTAYKRIAGAWVAELTGLDAAQFAHDVDSPAIVVSGAAYVQPAGSVGGLQSVYKAVPTFTPADETLSNVVSRLCLRAGMVASQFDVSALASITKPVRALAISQVSNTRVVLEMLASAYYFETVLSDKLYFRPRGGASVATIAYADLGASENPEGAAEPLALRPANDLEIPAQVALSYLNVDEDYQVDTQFSDRLISSVKTTNPVQLALGFTAAEAKAIANTMVMDAAASWLTTKLALLAAYARLEPTDIVVATAQDGTTLRMRLVRRSDGGSVLEFDAVLDDATALVNSATTSTDYTPTITVAAAPNTTLQLMDIPILRDADNDAGFYAAVAGSSTPYPGAALYRSTDDLEYARLLDFTDASVIGTCTTTLGNWSGGNVFDEANTVTVSVGAGQLASTARDNVLDAGANACLIGSEVLQFRNATLVSAGVYKLSGLLRGRRGTEAAMTGHAASERFILLRTSGLRRVALDTSEIGALRYYKGVTLGRKLSSAAAQQLTGQAVGLKPFSPVDLRAARDVSSGDITLTWSRRTRLSKNFGNGTVPLGETTEAYDVVVYTDGTFATVKRTISVGAASASYTSAQQVSDFGSNQATVYVRVYQLSSIVGRGNPAQGAL